jgi:hypothetical protein
MTQKSCRKYLMLAYFVCCEYYQVTQLEISKVIAHRMLSKDRSDFNRQIMLCTLSKKAITSITTKYI